LANDLLIYETDGKQIFVKLIL